MEKNHKRGRGEALKTDYIRNGKGTGIKGSDLVQIPGRVNSGSSYKSSEDQQPPHHTPHTEGMHNPCNGVGGC